MLTYWISRCENIYISKQWNRDGGVARARGIGFYNLEVFGEVGVMCAVGGVHRLMIGVGDNMVEVVTSLCGI